MEKISAINDVVNGFVWGPITIALIIGVGLILTIALKGIQFRNWGFLIKNTYGKTFSKKNRQGAADGEGEISSFQAAMASVSAVVGSGNIAGVATAIVAGGPGALFWMLVAAAIGMATKFAEIALGIKYREKIEDGSYAGGPMYYVAKGLHAPWLGKVMAVLVLLYSVVISAVVDTNTMVGATQEIFGGHALLWGLLFAGLTAVVIFGGITRIGEVCGFLAPFMAGIYLLCGILIIILNITALPEAIRQLLVYAFDPAAAFGGVAGYSVMTCMRYGFARGIFSNEAGIGTAAITHASAKVNSPGEQAIWGPLEVFVDTFIVCTVSGLTIVLTGLWDSGKEGVALTMAAFQKGLPGNWGHIVVFTAAILFGFSCLITYYNYVEKSGLSLFGPKCRTALRVLWLAFIMVGSYSTLGVVWDLADTINGIIIYPNLIALVVLIKEVVSAKNDYYQKELPLYKAEKAARKKGF